METITKFKAIDGKEFTDRVECIKYELLIERVKSVIKKQAIEFCEWLRKENWGETSGLTPTLWEHNRTGELSTTEMLYKKFIKSYENKRVKVIIKDQVV